MGILSPVLSRAIGRVLRPIRHGVGLSNGAPASAWTPAQWFLASEQGIWLDPSDLSTMFQDSAGTTPVTAVEQQVGLVLDKRLGLVEQEDTVTHPVIGTASGLWTHSADTVLRNGSAASQITILGAAMAATKKYWLRFTVAGFSGDPFTMHVGGSNIGMISANGSYRFLISGTGSSVLTVIPWGGAVGHATISAISIKELPGNHASQATSAARPVLQQDGNGSYYLAFDGVNDFLSTGSIDFTATDKMTVVAGVQVSSASVGIICELSPNAPLSDGAFYLATRESAAGDLSCAARGITNTLTRRTGSAALPRLAVVSAKIDLPNTTIDSCVEVQVNGAVPSLTGMGAANLGAAVFGNHQFYIGRRAGTSLPFNGHLYSLVVRGAATADLGPIESFTANKTGITLP